MVEPEAVTPAEAVGGEETLKDKPRAFLVYRSNDFYDEAIPSVAEKMRNSGIDVNVISFPAGTPEDQIKADLETKEDGFIGSAVFTDTTVGKSWRDHVDKDKLALGIAINPRLIISFRTGEKILDLPFEFPGGNYFDHAFNRITVRAIIKHSGLSSAESESVEDSHPSSADIDQYGKATSAVLGVALKKESPDKIYIRPDHLLDHPPPSRTRKSRRICTQMG